MNAVLNLASAARGSKPSNRRWVNHTSRSGPKPELRDLVGVSMADARYSQERDGSGTTVPSIELEHSRPGCISHGALFHNSVGQRLNKVWCSVHVRRPHRHGRRSRPDTHVNVTCYLTPFSFAKRS